MATSQAAANVEVEEELNPYRRLILAGLITAAIVKVLDTSIVNVVLPQMAGNLARLRRKLAGFRPAPSCPTSSFCR